MKLWQRYAGTCEALVDVAHKLLSCHATTCATERSWSLWGRVYTSSRNALGVDRAKRITICANTRTLKESDFAVLIAVVENDV